MEQTMRTVTATDANRNFSGLLRDVASGESILIVSRGTAVAKISPVDAKNAAMAAKETLLSRLSEQKATGQRDWTRNELYRGEFSLIDNAIAWYFSNQGSNVRICHNPRSVIRKYAKATAWRKWV